MTHPRVAEAVIIAALLGVALLAGGCAASSSAGSSTAVDGAEIVSVVCSRCHPLERVQAAQHDRAGWEATVARMRAHGAQLTDAQAQAVIDYLAK